MKKHILLAIMICLATSNLVAQKVTPLQPFYSTKITTGDMKSIEGVDINYIKSLDEFNYFYATKPNVEFIMEEFVPGHVETFDGITNSKKEILIYSSLAFLMLTILPVINTMRSLQGDNGAGISMELAKAAGDLNEDLEIPFSSFFKEFGGSVLSLYSVMLREI